MEISGEFAFVAEIPLTAKPEDSAEGLADPANRAVPGLVHGAIHRRIGNEGIVIYEARIGGPEDARKYRRGLRDLDKSRWYRPMARWVQPAGARRVAWMRTFQVISAAGAKDTVVTKLANLVELVIGQVPELKLAILHEGFDRPEEIMLYEEWDGTKAAFLAQEAPKPYRTAYREETAHMIADRGDLEWLSPIRIYEAETSPRGPR
jgi:hypothetical protein